jgi:5,6-dimethylbenzimidazole synthase
MSDTTRRADDIYSVIHRRRDVRHGFTGEPVADDLVERVLAAAHAAPSVGLSQPWDFVIVREHRTRTEFHRHVMTEREHFAASLPPDRRERFEAIRIEGILDASLSVVVTYDSTRAAPAVLGRHTIADTGLYSVCLAIENLWLAATAEGLGVGWVSFYREEYVRGLLSIPRHVRPVAWLCLGPVARLETTPDLERHGWRTRIDLASVVHHGRW